jgi:uncharacterized protein
MNPFKPLTLGDKNYMNKLLSESIFMKNYVSSELVFENLYAWKNTENIQIFHDETFILLKCDHESKTIFLPPISKSVESLISGINAIKHIDSNAMIYGLTKTMIDLLNPDDFLILEDLSLDEYVYLSKDLSLLKGSKYHRKRNLVNQFKKDQDFIFRPYQEHDILDVKNLLQRYLIQGGTDTDFDAIHTCLEHHQSLDIYIDLLYKMDTLVALSISAKSIFSHGVIMFEKADIDYPGSYAAINWLVSSQRFLDVTYITRQEDLGIPSLRKAKQSYYPSMIDKKYTLIFSTNYKEMYHLYKNSFDEKKCYIDYFFLYQTSLDQMYFVKNNQVIVSGQHIIMKSLLFNDVIIDVPFIVATATHQEYRHQGFMKRLMKDTFDNKYIKAHACVMLYPEDEKYYKKIGFIPLNFKNFEHKNWNKKVCSLVQTIDPSILHALYETFMKDKNGYFLRSQAYYESALHQAYLSSFSYSLIYCENQVLGYILHDGILIEEWIMIHEVLPIIDSFDFSKVPLYTKDKNQSGVMLRISNPIQALNLFKSMILIDREMTLSIFDSLLDVTTNIKLTPVNHTLKIEQTNETGIFLSIEQLSSALCHGTPISDIVFIKKPTEWMAIDMY